jgi:hypothetical protein
VPRTEVMTVARNLRTLATLVQFTLIIIKNLRIREFEIINYGYTELRREGGNEHG